MKKKTIIVCIIIVVIYLIFKTVSYFLFVDALSYENEGIKYGNTYTINTILLNEEDYLTYNSIKIRNDFDDYTKQEETNLRYIKRDENDKVEKAIFIGEDETYVELFKNNDSDIFSAVNIFNKNYINKVFEKNNINDDIDLMDYLINHYNDKTSFFSLYSKQKETYLFNMLANITMPSLESISLIEGDYEGYVLNVKNNIKEFSILKNDNRIYVTFIGDYDEEYIHELMNTVVIE